MSGRCWCVEPPDLLPCLDGRGDRELKLTCVIGHRDLRAPLFNGSILRGSLAPCVFAAPTSPAASHAPYTVAVISSRSIAKELPGWPRVHCPRPSRSVSAITRSNGPKTDGTSTRPGCASSAWPGRGSASSPGRALSPRPSNTRGIGWTARSKVSLTRTWASFSAPQPAHLRHG